MNGVCRITSRRLLHHRQFIPRANSINFARSSSILNTTTHGVSRPSAFITLFSPTSRNLSTSTMSSEASIADTAAATTPLLASSPDSRKDRSEEHTLTLPSGRTLGYAIYGVPLSTSPHPPIIYLHGYPSSRVEASLYSKSLHEANLTMVAIDRPGFGLSTAISSEALPSRTVLDHARDVEAVISHLSLDRVVVLGVSGGAPYALACTQVPGVLSRLIGVGILAGMGPYKVHLDPEVWRELWWLNKLGLIAPARFPWLYRILYGWVAPRLVRALETKPYDEVVAGAEKALRRSPSSANKADYDVLIEMGEGGYKDTIRTIHEAIRQPHWPTHHVNEARLLTKDWPYALADVAAGNPADGLGKVRVKLWYGTEDTSTPAAIGRKMAAQMPNAELVVVQKGTHSSVIMENLVPAAKDLLGIE